MGQAGRESTGERAKNVWAPVSGLSPGSLGQGGAISGFRFPCRPWLIGLALTQRYATRRWRTRGAVRSRRTRTRRSKRISRGRSFHTLACKAPSQDAQRHGQRPPLPSRAGGGTPVAAAPPLGTQPFAPSCGLRGRPGACLRSVRRAASGRALCLRYFAQGAPHGARKTASPAGPSSSHPLRALSPLLLAWLWLLLLTGLGHGWRRTG